MHQFAGLGKGDLSAEQVAKAVERQDAGQRWRSATTLIIDEISMVSAADFDRLSRIAQLLRHDARPFGGIQIIACGDFLQASPARRTSPTPPVSG